MHILLSFKNSSVKLHEDGINDTETCRTNIWLYFYLSNVHSLLLRINKNPNVRHKTLSLKVTSDETVTANNWQTRVLKNQFLTKEGIKLHLTESVGSPISLGKPPQHSCGHKRTLSICLALSFQYLSHSAGVNDTQFTVSTAQCSVSKWCHSAL